MPKSVLSNLKINQQEYLHSMYLFLHLFQPKKEKGEVFH